MSVLSAYLLIRRQIWWICYTRSRSSSRSSNVISQFPVGRGNLFLLSAEARVVLFLIIEMFVYIERIQDQ